MSVVRFELLLWLLIWIDCIDLKVQQRRKAKIPKWLFYKLRQVDFETLVKCMKCLYVLVVYVGSNGIGDGMTCPHWFILMMKKRDNKRQCDQLFMCDVLRKGWRLVESLLMWLHVCVVVKCAMLWKWSSPHYFCELVICIILTHWLSQVLCALKKNEYLRGCTI